MFSIINKREEVFNSLWMKTKFHAFFLENKLHVNFKKRKKKLVIIYYIDIIYYFYEFLVHEIPQNI